MSDTARVISFAGRTFFCTTPEHTMKKQMTPKAPTSNFTRRQFLRRTSLAVGAATFSFPYVGRVLGANDRVNVACIGVGGKGDSDSSDVSGCGGNLVAICDVDQNKLDLKAKQFATKF